MTAGPLVAAATYGVVALVWATLSFDFWHIRRARQLRQPLFRLLPLLAASAAVFYAWFVLYALTPTELDGRLPGLHAVLSALIDVSVVALLALGRHTIPLMAVRDAPPARGRRWFAVHYGLALLVVAAIVARVLAPSTLALWQRYWIVFMAYLGMQGFLCLRDLRGLARGGGWWPTALGEARRVDVWMIGGALACFVGMFVLQVIVGTSVQGLGADWRRPLASTTIVLLHAGAGFALAGVFAVRTLGRFGLQFPVTLWTVGVSLAVYLGAHALTARLAGVELRLLADVGATLALVALLVAGQRGLRAGLDRVVFRRSRRRWAELQARLHTLPPELGAAECSRRVLTEVVRGLGLQGAAIVLADGTVAVGGNLDPAPLVRVWTVGPEVEPGSVRAVLGGGEGRDLPRPFREALVEGNIGAVVPVRSPRRWWGRLFLSAGVMGAPSTDEDVQAMEAFAGQLALVLDTADLLARAVAVERTLAHHEKLAALGEVAARIAHEIRNPVTAARSLAQQLARAAGDPGDPEAAQLILTELERVERHVAALLRFARREEFRFEAVDLAALAGATIEGFRPRLQANRITLALDLRPATATADREKCRQVLVNLIENAIDALGEVADGRTLTVAADTQDGAAVLSVADTGPGVPADVLPHLFEPFFSRKPQGTGLGLAIVQRTVSAHGGRIEAVGGAGTGMTFRIVLPRAGGA